MSILNELTAKIKTGEIHNIKKPELELYLVALCEDGAGQAIGGQKYSQICETVRLLLFKQYLEEIDRKNSFLQKLVIALSVLAVICSFVQIYVSITSASKPIEIIHQYTQPQVFKPISSQVRK